jgi:hypothetical protein
MSLRRLQGLALILGALIDLLVFFAPASGLKPVLAVLSSLLFIFGIPAVHAAQRDGTPGLLGLVLLILAVLIVIAFRLDLFGNAALSSAFALTSAIFGLLGRLIVGWLTTRRPFFAAWIGWAFILEGLLNLLIGLANLGSASSFLSALTVLVGAAAVLGYGLQLFQKRTA